MKMRAEWSNTSRNCTLGNTTSGRYNIVATTVNDVAQLIIMLIGLLRTRREKHGFLRYLYIQVGGVAFRFLAIDHDHAEIGQGPGMACCRDDSRDPVRSKFWSLGSTCRMNHI